MVPFPSQAHGKYNSAEVLATVKNPNAPGDFPIRRGYYDSHTNRGFGYDKAYHKHGLTSLEAIKKVAVSPHSKWQGNTLVSKAYVGKYTCRWIRCYLEDQREVRVVFTTATQHYDLKFNSQLGMMTAYCENPDKAPRCPSWVQDSILRPGTPLAHPAQGLEVFTDENQTIEITIFSYDSPAKTMSR